MILPEYEKAMSSPATEMLENGSGMLGFGKNVDVCNFNQKRAVIQLKTLQAAVSEGENGTSYPPEVAADAACDSSLTAPQLVRNRRQRAVAWLNHSKCSELRSGQKWDPFGFCSVSSTPSSWPYPLMT